MLKCAALVSSFHASLSNSPTIWLRSMTTSIGRSSWMLAIAPSISMRDRWPGEIMNWWAFAVVIIAALLTGAWIGGLIGLRITSQILVDKAIQYDRVHQLSPGTLSKRWVQRKIWKSGAS